MLDDPRAVLGSLPQKDNTLQDSAPSDVIGIDNEYLNSHVSRGTNLQVDDPAIEISNSAGGATAQIQNAYDPSKRVLNTADLIKIFEITLTEIRTAQTFAFSVLGFSVASGVIILKMHDAPKTFHDFFSIGFWGVGVLSCLLGAILTGLSGRQYLHFVDFIRAAEDGKPEYIFPLLIGALNKARASLRWFHLIKWPTLFGAFCLVLAVFIEVVSNVI